jgi:predicted enzyme related to lactoylglutathione lyase
LTGRPDEQIEETVSYESRTGAVLFARRMEQVAAFYANVLELSEAGRDADHIRLESPAFQLVVHRIPDEWCMEASAESPARRATAAFKPVFFVPSLAAVRTIATALGGSLEPAEKQWSFNGVVVCDAADPEGNVIQLREADALRPSSDPG